MIYIGTGLIAALVSISVGACLIAVLTVGNIQLSYLDPDRYMAVTVREKVGWWMRTRPFQKVADELAALGFVEIGAKTEHLGFIRIAVRVFYNAELRTFAELSSQSFRPRVGLISSLPDGTIIKSAHAWTGAWRGSPVLREYAVHGSLSNRLEEHDYIPRNYSRHPFEALFFRKHLLNVIYLSARNHIRHPLSIL